MEMVLFYFNEGPYAIYSDKVRTIGNAHSKLIYYQDKWYHYSYCTFAFQHSINILIIQEGEVERSDKHAEIAMNADRYNPAGSYSF